MIQEIIAAGQPVSDPQGVPGALQWIVPGALRGWVGNWELIVDLNTNTVLHFLTQLPRLEVAIVTSDNHVLAGLEAIPSSGGEAAWSWADLGTF